MLILNLLWVQLMKNQWKAEVDTWLQRGGSTIIKEYEEAFAKNN